MFHTAARLGFQPVALLLLFRQRMASVAPFAYPVLHPIFFQRFLQTYIRAVRIQLLPLVILSEQVIQVASCSKSRRTSGTAPRTPRSSPISHGTAISSSRQAPCPRLTGRESGGTTAQRVAYLGEPLLPILFVKQCQVSCRFVLLHGFSFLNFNYITKDFMPYCLIDKFLSFFRGVLYCKFTYY